MNKSLMKRALWAMLPTCVITLGVMLALIACTGNLKTMAQSNDAQALHGQRVFLVNSHTRPTVILRGNAGMMHVVVGRPGRVIIQYVVRHRGAGRPATVAFSQNGRTNTVMAREIDFPRVSSSSNDEVDFSVIAPEDVNLDFATSSGSISASGVEGRMVLSTHAGNVSTNHVFFEGNSLLLTQSGNITLGGNVQAGSTCRAQTSAGSVDAFFPSSARVAITASLALGTISSDFSSISTSSGGAHGFIGRAPYGNVLISIQVGTISIHRL